MQGDKKEHIYFMGIGGIGMSGIAEILLDFGYRISGSDIKVSNVTERLQKKGASIYIGQRAENITDDIDYVVRSTAIRDTNEEYMRVKELGLPVLHRSQMLAKLMEEKKAICVAGAHGKTTTSSMIALAMELAQKEPTIVVGGEIAQIGSNAKSGNGTYLVAEADESDGSFLNLHPWMTVITNVEEDHLDHYKDLDAIRDAFVSFVKMPGEDGVAVLNYDCAETRQLAQYVTGKVISYGMAEDANIRGVNVRQEQSENLVDVYADDHLLGTLRLRVPGLHNISNALATVAAGLAIGMTFEELAAGLKEFGGARRRFQLLGVVQNIQIIDDYAHHPTEVAATIGAAKGVHSGRVVAVFQPHRYSRTKFLAEKFAQAFDLADEVVLTDVYSAGEDLSEGAQSDIIAQHMTRPSHFVERERLNAFLQEFVQPGDMVLMMGAGNIWQNSIQLVEDLKQK
ncbi:MAG: UDP-N-acetylmuramate--L-alanine ligase [Peptococcaceae bacterium]|nr:UDP-N-acetylmuramate--L-alanine ligase [Peptococcaceae bacterium]MBQ5369505.1 UDP-N-acetylmuramate--L-alanine ligase [Peptococcaceae bacterium]MBQ5659079.1 UDP-N-acetylmuramate--L-alanine ligase [Peptococcaceae bacterium]MBQ5706924.1 UDP-N-acetylmuramate--L-alanine ligase [Peptococcaceae bacterium]MBQ5863662.1 UDP-N-acetylmuramate--L-alanine ligase [Peptococcaceae bacterium]